MAASKSSFGGSNASPAALKTFELFHSAIASRNAAAVADLCATNDDEVLFFPPTFFRPLKGRLAMQAVLSGVMELIGDHFKYHRQWRSEDGLDWVLEFESKMKGEGRDFLISGVDMLHLNDQGRIVEFKVMIRPHAALTELKRQMSELVPIKIAELKEQMQQQHIASSTTLLKKSDPVTTVATRSKL